MPADPTRIGGSSQCPVANQANLCAQESFSIAMNARNHCNTLKETAILLLLTSALSVKALPTYEPFTEYISLITASGSNSVDLATSGFYLTNGPVVEQWGGGSSGFGLFFKQTGADVQVTNNPNTVFTSANLSTFLPAGFPGAAGNINITAFIPQNSGSGTAGNSAVLKFAQVIPRPDSGLTIIRTIYEVTGSGSAYTTWTSMFNTFVSSVNYVAYV